MSAPLVFTRRDWLIGLLIVLLAFGYRVLIIVDRAHDPITAAFAPLPVGTDQATYYSHIAAFHAGDFPPPRYYYQPGMSWFLIAADTLLGSRDLALLRLLTAALAAINCGLMFAAARLAFTRQSIGALAGLLLALYSVGAFYDTDFVITAQATILVTLALFGTLWLWRRLPGHWTGALLLGLSGGALAVTRFELVALLPVLAAWLFWQRRDRIALLQVGLAVVLATGMVLPVVWHNHDDGADYLISPNGLLEVYRGNNRDADGTRTDNPASESIGADGLARALRLDIQLAPRRFAELVLHKVGLYFSPHEPGNNLSYVLSGEAVSPWLRANPLDFRALLALFLFGMAVALLRREPAGRLLGLLFLTMMAATLAIWIEARVRTPVIAVMMPGAAYGLVALADPIRPWLRTPRPAVREAWPAWRALLLPVPIIALLLLGGAWTERELPRPQTVQSLPAAAQPAGAVYDGVLRLAGWQVQEQYSRAGIITPFQPYVVTLYWELLAPTNTDYSFSLGYFVAGERVIAFDRPIGTVSYPAAPTSAWDVGRLYVEHVGITYKRFEGPVAISGNLLLSVYPERDAARLIPPVGVPGDPPSLMLTRPAIIWGAGALPDSLPLAESAIAFGEMLRLIAWDLPATAAPGETLTVHLGWQTTGDPITRSLIFSVQLLDAQGVSAAQHDSPPHAGRLLASSLPTRYRFGDEKTLDAPTAPGRYTWVVIVYDYETGARLAVPDTPDNILRLGQLEVRPAAEDTPHE